MKPLPTLAASGIGSVPFLDLEQTLDRLARLCPDLPYWPQMIKSHPEADMILQYAVPLPFLENDPGQKKVTVNEENRADALTEFYEKFLAEDLEYFALPKDSAGSFYAFLDLARANPGLGRDFLKGQVTGPITLGQAVRDKSGKTILDDPELADALVKGLGLQAAWQAGQIRDSGRIPIIFFDEPALTGFGSAFSNLQRETVVSMLNEVAELARTGGEVLTGIHICGNSDWDMVLSTSLDVINFDAFGYLDHFLLFPAAIKRFIDRGGYLAWGIAPTLDYTGRETPEELADRLTAGMSRLAGKGLELDRIRKHSIITPACGLGPLDEATAGSVLELTAKTSDILRNAK